MNKTTDKGLRNIVILLSVLALAILGYDIYEVSTGQADLNKHIPFFLPAILGVFILITLKIGKLTSDDPATAAKARAEMWPDSGLNPKNTDRASEGHLE